MDNERHIEAAADRIVRWAASHPLSLQEAESRYAHLLNGLPAMERDRPARWSAFRLGRLAVRYLQDQVEDLQQSLAAAVSPAAAFRGAGPAAASPAPERILRADGRSAAACVKLTGNADEATLDLALWLEPKQPGADLPFTVTVLDAAKARLGDPVECAARSLIRFDAIAPAEEYTLIFATAAERWEIRWGFSPPSAPSPDEAIKP
jgi:hypothetical protein